MFKIAPKIKGKLLFNEPLSRHTTFRIGGPCEIWAEPADEAELKTILRFARKRKKKIFIMGNGSNMLFRDRGFRGIVVHLSGGRFKKISFAGAAVRAGAGASLGRLVDAACRRGLEGIEGLAGIPGTLGGAIFMNASYIQKISDSLEKIKVLDKSKGNAKVIKRKDIKFGYRHSSLRRYIILEATLRLRKNKRQILLERVRNFLKEKRRKQPLGLPSAGCVFKNPAGISAGQYIEMAGLKGKRIGGAEVSCKHANFIVNLRNAKSKDVERLINFVKRRVKSRFNVKLVPEVRII